MLHVCFLQRGKDDVDASEDVYSALCQNRKEDTLYYIVG